MNVVLSLGVRIKGSLAHMNVLRTLTQLRKTKVDGRDLCKRLFTMDLRGPAGRLGGRVKGRNCMLAYAKGCEIPALLETSILGNPNRLRAQPI